MARSVRDVALMLDAAAGYSPQDSLSFHTSFGSYVTDLKAFDAPTRVAFSEDLGILPMAREVAQMARTVCAKISSLGIVVSDEFPNFWCFRGLSYPAWAINSHYA